MSLLPSNQYGHTELIRCILKKNIDGAITLIENDTDLNKTDMHGFSPLMYAIRQRHLQVTNRLIAKGCDVNSQNRAMETALHLVVKGYYQKQKRKDDWIKFLGILLENGADVNIRDKQGFPPIMWAVKNNTYDMVAMLIKAGADVNLPNYYLDTCLHIAVISRTPNVNVIECLLSNGADCNLVDMKSQTPIVKAMERRINEKMVCKQIASGLKNSGCDVEAFNLFCKAPFMHALENGLDDLVLLLNNKRHNYSAMDIATNRIFISGGSVLLNDLICKAPIMHALKNGLDDLVLSLIEKCCKKNVFDFNTKRSVLWFAFKNKSIKIMNLLLEKRAELNEFFLEEFHNLDAFGINSIPSANMLTAMIKHGLRTDALPDHDKYPGLLCYILMKKNYVFEDITDLFDLLYISGSCTQKQLFLLLDDPQMLDNFQSVPKKREWIIQKCSQPLTLKEISRIHVLKNWEGHNLSTFINGLPIKTSLREYLTFPEFSIDDREIPNDFSFNCIMHTALQIKDLCKLGSPTENQIQKILSESQNSLRPFWEGSDKLTLKRL